MLVEMKSPEAAEHVVADEFTITVIVDSQEFDRTLLTELISSYTNRKRKETLSFKKKGKKGTETGKPLKFSEEVGWGFQIFLSCR